MKLYLLLAALLFSVNSFCETLQVDPKDESQFLDDVRTYWNEYLSWKKKIMGDGQRFIGRGFQSSKNVDHDRFYKMLEMNPNRVPMDLIKITVEQGYRGSSFRDEPPEWYMRAHFRLHNLEDQTAKTYSESKVAGPYQRVKISDRVQRTKDLFEKIEMANRLNRRGKPVIEVSSAERREFVETATKHAPYLPDEIIRMALQFVQFDNSSSEFDSFVIMKLELLNRFKSSQASCSRSFSRFY